MPQVVCAFGVLFCIVRYVGSREQQALSDGTRGEKKTLALGHVFQSSDIEMSIGIAP